MKNDSNHSRVFVLLVLSITWLFSWFLFSDEARIQYFPLIMFLPAFLALIINTIRYRSIKQVFLPIINRINIKAILFSILYPLLFIGGTALVLYSFGLVILNEDKLAHLAQFPPLGAVLFGFLLMFGEGYGWRGFLLKDLTDTYGKIKAAMIVGVVWAIWHCPIVYGLAVSTHQEYPVLLTLIQMGAVFVFSIPFAHSYFLSGNILPPMIFHFVWNYYNPMILGNIYRNRQGIFEGELMFINGEGLAGVLFGSFFILWFILKFREKRNLLSG